MKIFSFIFVTVIPILIVVPVLSDEATHESPGLYVAKIVSDFAGKKIQQECGPIKDGRYIKVNTVECKDAVNSIRKKISPTLKDCQANLLPIDACIVVKGIDEALNKIFPSYV